MVNSSQDLGELINKLETPLGRANAVNALSNKYILPDELVREAIATFEAQYDNEQTAAEEQWRSRDTQPLKTAATLARKILWIDKTVDLMVKARDIKNAADIAERFGLDERALGLFKEEGSYFQAMQLAEKLEKWDDYIELSLKQGEQANAIKKCRELGREEEAKEIVKNIIPGGSSRRARFYKTREQIIEIIKSTGMAEYAMELCRENQEHLLAAQIAAATLQHETALEYFKKAGEPLSAAYQALQLTELSPHYFKEARELFLEEAGKLEETGNFADLLHVLKEMQHRLSFSEETDKRILDVYARMEKFEEGAKYFAERDRRNIPKALELLEKGNLIQNARSLAEMHGLADKEREYAEILDHAYSKLRFAEEDGDVSKAIECYTELIDRESDSYFAAKHALKAAEFCASHGEESKASEFREQARKFFLLETKRYEECGLWTRAAENAVKAGDMEKAELYQQIDRIARAFHAL